MSNNDTLSGKSRDSNIYVTEWIPDKVKGTIVIVHGIGEHIGRYAAIAKEFNRAGYAVFGFDLPGHGHSGGKRGVLPPLEKLLDIISNRLNDAAQCYPHTPHFLYGHSLGGSLVLDYDIRRKPVLSGIIASGVPFKVYQKVPGIKLFLVNLLSGIAPSITMDTGLDLTSLSSDPAVVEAYKTDPLVHSQGSVSFGAYLLKGGPWLLDHANEFPPVPLLLMQGSEDHIVSTEAVRSFAQRCSSPITYKEWTGFLHEIHHEPDKDQVYKFKIDWLDAQNKPGTLFV
jgi:alpha-beta hydrolase superfamily lysophospholipase